MNTRKTVDYDHSKIEEKWRKKWEETKIYQPDLDKAKKPFYNLMMFPYPSAEGLHVGSVFTFTGVDTYGRFKRMQGYDVFEPMGLDGFGIHSENYALKVGKHPKEQAKISEENFYRQLRSIGNSFDWSRKLETYDPNYYKWTQWIFIQLFKKGLAFRGKAPVNFCPSCKTVLADEQVIDGKCERCNTIVEKKDLEQWFFRITTYADRLLNNLEKLDWTAKVKIAQKEWIGRSEGARIEFKVKSSKFKVEVFTTAIDTVYGVTFMAISPEHPLSASIEKKEVKEYIQQAKQKTEQERAKKKTGVDTGLVAINPINNEQIPVWVADYVLMGYGTGAIMGVSGHDARDYEFAKKYNLPIKPVIKPIDDSIKVNEDGFWDYEDIKKNRNKSVLFDSKEFDGLKSDEAKRKLIEHIEKNKFGKKEVQYHLRDWLISRQRYWGPPIPMIYCEKCVWQPVPEDQLPVLLPDVKDWKPKGTGMSPLANHPEFYKTTCPNCGAAARRETDVLDTFLDSAWYFFRYIGTEFDTIPFPSEGVLKSQINTNDQNSKIGNWKLEIGNSAQRAAKWLPVHMYIGGAEHSVLHLLYSRFITMVFKDMGLIDFEEPYSRFYAHGLIIKEGAKMSKSKGNVVNPDQYLAKYGADVLRAYLRFVGPFNQGGDFRDSGIEGMSRFLKRVWVLCHSEFISESQSSNNKIPKQVRDDMDRAMHRAIKDVTYDLENLRFNTAVAHIMEYYNELHAFYTKYKILDTKYCKTLVLLLAPIAPFMAEELWEFLGEAYSVHTSTWPSFDPKLLQEDEVTVVVQVNGKVRSTLRVDSSKLKVKSEIEQLAKESDKAKKHLEGKEIKKVVYVEGKIINFVVD